MTLPSTLNGLYEETISDNNLVHNQIENILVGQKDLIRELILRSVSLLSQENLSTKEFLNVIKGFQSALFTLKTVRHLWIHNSYGYKLNELLLLIDDACRHCHWNLPSTATMKRRELDAVHTTCKASYTMINI